LSALHFHFFPFLNSALATGKIRKKESALELFFHVRLK
jgi:hypothetical protein